MPASPTLLSPARLARYPSLEDRTVLITGGASGIGAMLVICFAQQGARVGFIDLDEAAAHTLLTTLAGVKYAPFFVRADLTNIAQLQHAVACVRDRCGPIGVLLNNAANDQRHEFSEVSSEQWDQIVAVNLKHQFFAAQAVASDMKQLGGGSILHFGSASWMMRSNRLPVYTTCKAAVHGMTRSMAKELGPHNIRVNALVPGWVMTEKQLQLWVDDAGRAEIDRNQCIKQPLMPVHIAAMALFLAADDSAMCTSQIYIVDAGWV